MTIPMPPRNSTAEVVARAAGKCLRLACERCFPSVELGQLSEVVSGGTPSTDRPEYWGGDVVWVTPKDLGKPRNIEILSAERSITEEAVRCSAARLLPAGTVLLSSRAPIGHLAIAGRPLATNQGFKNLICSERLCNRYLFHVLRGSIDDLINEGHGNTFLEITGGTVRGFRIPVPRVEVQHSVAAFLDTFYRRLAGDRCDLPGLPVELAEQRCLVERIEELAAEISGARALRQEANDEAEALARAIARQVFSRCSVRDSIGALADVRGGIQKTPDRLAGASPVRYLTVAHVQRDHILTTDVRFFEVTTAELERWRLLTGDVLIIEGNGSSEQIGRSALFRGEIENCVHQNHVIRIRAVAERLDSEFLNAFLNSPLGQEAVQAQSRTTSGLRTLSVGRIKGIRVPVPSLEDQRRSVAELAEMHDYSDALKILQTANAAELDALLPAILDRAFKGEL